MTDNANEVTKAPSRDDLRAAIFNAKPKSEIVENFLGGTTIELRQPPLRVALEQRNVSEEDRMFYMLQNYTFVPGTKERLFERGDIETMKDMPFGAEFQNLMDALNRLLGINPQEVEAQIKEAEKSA